jgi:hypothetical protein
MNTVMEDKIKKAFEEWKQTEQPKENKMVEAENTTKNKQLSNMLLAKITAQPGITGKELRAYIAQAMPNVPVTYVPAILKGFYDKNFVNRIEVAPDGEKGRTTYSYTAIPVAVRANMPKREKVKAYTKKSKVKAKAHTKVKEDKGITGLVPAERTERVTTSPLAVGATTLHITISTSDASYTLRLEEAKFIYQQLNQIFGGVR